MKRRALISVLASAALWVALLALWSCNTGGCYDNQNSIPKAAMYSSATGSAMSVRFVGIRGAGAPHDSVLVDAGRTFSEVYLPMRPGRPSTEWYLEYKLGDDLGDVPGDTVIFTYDSEPVFVSEECGAMYRYRIRRCDFTTNVVDSVVVTDSLITNVDKVSIRIYFPELGGGELAEQQGDEG